MNDLNNAVEVNTEVQEQPVVQEQQPVLAQQQEHQFDFRQYLADDLKANPALESFKDINGLVKSYLNAQQVIGRRFEDLTPEQLNLYYNKMGRPENPDGYSISDEDLNDPMVGWYKQTAHKLGLGKQAAEELYQAYKNHATEIQAQQNQKMQEVSDQYIKQLKQDFGHAFDERIQMAQRAVRELGGPELQQLLANPLIGDHPAVVKAFSEMGRRLMEHKGITGQGQGFKISPEEAAMEIENLNRDPEFLKAYMNHRHPGHKEAVNKKQSLYQIAYGDN